MSETAEPRAIEFGSFISQGSLYLSKQSQIDDHEELLPYAHYLRQAWTEIGLSGVLCVDGRPTVYLCEAADFTPDQKRTGHRFVWNQGLVPLLVFVTPSQVEVHSAVKMPKPAEGLFDGEPPGFIPDLGDIADALEGARFVRSFVRSVETGQFFQEYAEFFPADQTVDRYLLKNLVYTARSLTGTGWKLPEAHALLGRALFIAFLAARKFIKSDYYPVGTSSLLDILILPDVEKSKRLLYQEFFPRLKREFNGTMFDAALDVEEADIDERHLQALAHFLGHHDAETGQMELGLLEFSTYDFRVIPVEIISAIYEEFMKEADLTKKRSEGAYYTPRHLAETTLHVALEGRYAEVLRWRVLDPACGSGIFLVAMFNLLAELWQRENSDCRRETKAQALLDILQKQIRGVDDNLDACRITAFSLYLALFEKLQPMDVEEFKQKIRQGPFLPALVWRREEQISTPVVFKGDFLNNTLPLENDFDLIVGNPPWKGRGDKQIALRFAENSEKFLRRSGIGCLLLPSSILVNRTGILDGAWFRKVTVERIVQLADFRHVLFAATHACFILRYQAVLPTLEGVVRYETPKLNRFDLRQGVIVIEPDDLKLVPQRDILEAALQNRLQSLWSRKFWGTPRDEAFLRRLDFYPHLSKAVSERNWGGGVGCQPYYPGISPDDPELLEPWKLSDQFLANSRDFPRLIVRARDLSTLGEELKTTVHRTEKIKASLTHLRRKPDDGVFTPPMVIYSKGFTKCVFSNFDHEVRFFDGLRSITASKSDGDLLRFLSAVIGSHLFKYITFHSGSNSGIERDQIHVYESLALPFPLPNHELAVSNADDIITEVAGIFNEVERAGMNASASKRSDLEKRAVANAQPLVEEYYSVTDAEKMLIDDTLELSKKSIHKSNLDADANIPSLKFPDFSVRKSYADTLCDVLNRRARKDGLAISAEGRISKKLNLVFLTVIFADTRKSYSETGEDEKLWESLDRISNEAQHNNGPFSYLRGFSYFEADRLHILKPATMRNWCRTAALNDADAIFEHMIRRNG